MRQKDSIFDLIGQGAPMVPRNLNRNEISNPKAPSFVVCFCGNSLGPSALIEVRFRSAQYLVHLANFVIPFGTRQFPVRDYYLLHDNCSIHRAIVVENFLNSVLPGSMLPHPPYSPDLNPIEKIEN